MRSSTNCSHSGEEFAVSQFDLSHRYDIRPLVLRTALTYLEMLHVLRQGTPYYAGYEFAPRRDRDWIVGQFQGEPAELVSDLFTKSKFGRKWHSIEPDSFADNLGKPRGRIVKALEILEQREWIELKVSDLRQCYYRLPGDQSAAELASELAARYIRREVAEAGKAPPGARSSYPRWLPDQLSGPPFW